jgi:hypothetical protein
MPSADYGRCSCGSPFRIELCDIELKVEQRNVTLTRVPHGRCTRCGVRVLKADALERIEGVLRGPKSQGAAVMRP